MARVLIVDDDPSDRLLEATVLRQAGHEVFFAEDGASAIEVCLADGVEVVVTDLQMPEVHGFELITKLRDLPTRPSLIAVSGTGPYQLEMAHALGATFTLSKPIQPQLLTTAVEQLVQSRESVRKAEGAG